MDDMAGKIETLLSDPESLRNLQELASMFSSDESAMQDEQTTCVEAQEDVPPIDIGKLMAVGQAMQEMENDENITLLLALKPILNANRRKRVDKAVKLLRLYSVAEVLREQGLLRDVLGGEG